MKATDVVPLNDMKVHLRVDHDADDRLIELYAQAALEWCCWYCDNPKLDQPKALPENFKSAFLLVLGDLYLQRESNAVGARYENPTAANLLWMSRNWLTEKAPPPVEANDG